MNFWHCPGPGNPVRSAKSRPFWPGKVRCRRPLHLLQSIHFNDLSFNTNLKWFLVIRHPIKNPKTPLKWCMRALKLRTRSNISGGVTYLSGVFFQVILWRSYWTALWNWPHAIYFLRIVGYGHELWRPDVFNILPDMNPFRNSNGILGCIIESNEARNGIIEKVWNESHFSKEISWPLFYK